MGFAYNPITGQLDKTGSGASVNSLTDSFTVTVDGGGAVVTTGSKGFKIAPCAGTIIGWAIVADQAGDVEFGIEKATDETIPSVSIVASAPPLLSADQVDRSTVLTGWTTAFSQFDVFEFTVGGTPATITRATLQVFYTKS